MRVLAVAQVLHLLEGEAQAVGEGLVDLGRHVGPLALLDLREVAGDGRLVATGVAEGLLREEEAGGRVDAALAVELLEEEAVVGGVHHDRDVAEVLGRRPHHRRAADVHVLDRLVERAALRHLVLEGVEVHDHHVDRGDPVLREGGQVLGGVAAREDAAVDRRVQRLHAAVEDLREPGGLRDAGHLHARLLELGRGAAGGEDLEAALREAAGEVHDPLLAVHGQERSLGHGASGAGGRRSSARLPLGVLGPHLAGARRARRVAPRLAPHGEPGGGGAGDRAGVGERGDRPRGRAVVEAAVVHDPPAAEELRPDDRRLRRGCARGATARAPAGPSG